MLQSTPVLSSFTHFIQYVFAQLAQQVRIISVQ